MNCFSQRVDTAIEKLLITKYKNGNRFAMCHKTETKNNIPIYFWPEEYKDKDIFVLVHQGEVPWGTHRHAYFIFNCVYSGTFSAMVNGRQCELKSSDIYFLQPNAVSCVNTRDGKNGILISVAAKKEFMRRHFVSMISGSPTFLKFFINCMDNSDSARTIEFKNGFQGAVRHLLREMIIEAAEQEESYGKLLESYFSSIIILLSREYDASFEETASEKHITVEPIMKYIASHFDTITLAQAAEHFNYSANYLSNVLRRETGHSFNGLVKAFKIERACQLLAQTDIPISVIASMVGYPHLSNFHKVFKASTGLTPNEYRKHKIEEKLSNLEESSCKS